MGSERIFSPYLYGLLQKTMKERKEGRKENCQTGTDSHSRPKTILRFIHLIVKAFVP